MRVSSRVHYGVRAMSQIARYADERPVSLSEIAAVEHLPLPYLEQLFAPLRRANLVEGTRGAHGGYRLTRAATDITVGDIVRALEPEALAPVECLLDTYIAGSCVVEGDCASRPLWNRVKEAADRVLDATSLADLERDRASTSSTKGLAVARNG